MGWPDAYVDPSQHVVLVPTEAPAVRELEGSGDQVRVLGIRRTGADRGLCLPDEGRQLLDEQNFW